MRLTNLRLLGRYTNPETQNEVNVHTGKQVGRSIDVLFYYYQNKRIPISDRDFYNEWKKVSA